MPNLLKLADARAENARWPIDSLLEKIDEYDEVLIIARKKGQNSYTKFHGRLGDTFWWCGVLERVKLLFFEEACIVSDDESD
jgi:hypothetical protein